MEHYLASFSVVWSGLFYMIILLSTILLCCSVQFYSIHVRKLTVNSKLTSQTNKCAKKKSAVNVTRVDYRLVQFYSGNYSIDL